MSIDHSYKLVCARSNELRAAGNAAIMQRGVRVDLLVAIPSNADSVAAATVFLAPKRVLLLMTEDLAVDAAAELDAWLETWPHAWKAPRIERIPGDGGRLGAEQILATLDTQLSRCKPANVVVLATTGTTGQKARLLLQAACSGWHVLETPPQYGSDRRPISGSIQPGFLEVPYDVRVRQAFLRARQLLAGQAFGEAKAVIEEIAAGPKDFQKGLYLLWIEACSLRTALRFEACAERCKQILSRIGGAAYEVGKLPEIQALKAGASALAEIAEALVAVPPPDVPRSELIAEILVRADRERDLGRLNHAALLYYRAAEACLTERLRCRYGIDADDGVVGPVTRADGTQLEPEELQAATTEAGKRIGSRHAQIIRRPIALATVAPLILALEVRHELEEPFKDLLVATESRNKSILAHGYQPVEEKLLHRFRGAFFPKEDPRAGLIGLIAPDGRQFGAFKRLMQRHEGPDLETVGPGKRGSD